MSSHPTASTSPPYIIVLIGLMGAGKTTLGRRLAHYYDIPFIDTDVEIEKASGKTIPEIFTEHGEAYFREGEHKVIARLLTHGPCILATGGGAWMDARTRHLINTTPHTLSIWLDAPLEVLAQRLSHASHERPLLTHTNLTEKLHSLASERNPFYAQADIIIKCGDETVEQGVQTICNHINQTVPPQKVPVTLAGHQYDVLIGTGLLEKSALYIEPFLTNRHAVILTDETVAELHLSTLLNSFSSTSIRLDVLRVPAGESSKSIKCFKHTMEALLSLGIERGTTLIAFGGGVVGDLGGFIAASALRGIPFIQIPTTLLAQVDSSVGGKTGINASAGKNLIGAFWQPQLVLADTAVLKTLPRRQLVAGYAEIIKAGLIADPALFEWCEENGRQLLEGSLDILGKAVEKACHFKARVVHEDEREKAKQGGRALLNLGHTFAHAFEAEFHYDGRLLHGEAVSIGLHMALALSVKMGIASHKDLQRLDYHLEALQMPQSARDLPHPLNSTTLVSHMKRDKKIRDGRVNFVLLRSIGDAFTCHDVDMKQVYELFINEGFLK